MSLKTKIKDGKAMGGSLPPILKMTEKKGSEFLGTFVEYRHIEKEIRTGKKTEKRSFDVFTFVAIEAEGLVVTAGEMYSIFASGHLRHLLSDVIANPESFKGKKFFIGYVGPEKMNSGAFKGKDAHKFEVTVE